MSLADNKIFRFSRKRVFCKPVKFIISVFELDDWTIEAINGKMQFDLKQRNDFKQMKINNINNVYSLHTKYYEVRRSFWQRTLSRGLFFSRLLFHRTFGIINKS